MAIKCQDGSYASSIECGTCTIERPGVILPRSRVRTATITSGSQEPPAEAQCSRPTAPDQTKSSPPSKAAIG
eukprot:2917617-Prymnesium_polylepis.1